MKTWIDRVRELSGEDYIYISLIYLEAFVVNIIMNTGMKVPDIVSLDKLSQGTETPVEKPV
jgi:hypothetical protein|tara:strand:- start:4358 stop:4540 length:183 start_codon:yes stop_codon:yes gene_type:complete